jgi:GT2 family glycosyltransferase
MTASAYSTPLDRITVSVVTYESQHCMAELGRHLLDFPYVTVVDNASADDTLAAAKQHLPQAHIICNATNLGFGAANNRAITQATTEFVLLLNPDCTMTPEAAVALLEAADRYPNASAIGPQLFDGTGQPEMGYRMRLDRWAAKSGPAEGDLCVEFLSGACVLIRRDALQHIGGFDEDFFLYQEDHDLCLRLAKECGELVLCPGATATHLSRRSSGGKHRYRAEYVRGYHHIQSKFIFDQKYSNKKFGTSQVIRYVLMAIMETGIRLCLLDFQRAIRAWGRSQGAWRFNFFKKQKITPLVITSCVDVSAPLTHLNNPNERIQLTIEALKQWFLIDTKLPIVLCDGSGYDFTQVCQNKFPNANIECLFFKNDYHCVKIYGKGYGEGEIINYAIKHSKTLKKYHIFAKCTSKLWVTNFRELSKSQPKKIFCEIKFRGFSGLINNRPDYIDTRFFIVDKNYYLKKLSNAYQQVNDLKGFYLEHAFKEVIISNEINLSSLIFFCEPEVLGISGSTGECYKKINPKKQKIYKIIYKHLTIKIGEQVKKLLPKETHSSRK